MVARKRVPKGNKNGGQFTPDLTGKNPPAGKNVSVDVLPSSEDVFVSQDAYQRQLDTLIARGVMKPVERHETTASVEEVIARLTSAEWQAVFEHAASLNRDAGFAQGYEAGREDGYAQSRIDAAGNVELLTRFDPTYEEQNDPYMNPVEMLPDSVGEYVKYEDVLGAVGLPVGAVDAEEELSA